MPRIKKLLVQKIMSDEDISKREGTWFTEDDLVHPIIRNNIDVYYHDQEGNEVLLLKYRKNQISDELCELGWKSYKDLAKPSRGRGASAGPIDVKGQYFSKRSLVQKNKVNYLLMRQQHNGFFYLNLQSVKYQLKEQNI